MTESVSSEMLARLMTLHEVRVPLTVGRATVAWNTLSGEVFGLFKMLSEMSEDAAKAVFFAVASDRSQRDMVRNLVDQKINLDHPKIAKKAKSLFGEADKLAGKRNDLLHVVYIDSLNPSGVSQLQERGHLKDKSGLALLDAIDEFTIACLDLSMKITQLLGEILETPRYQNLLLAEALLKHGAQRKPEEWADRGGFGLLAFPRGNH